MAAITAYDMKMVRFYDHFIYMLYWLAALDNTIIGFSNYNKVN